MISAIWLIFSPSLNDPLLADDFILIRSSAAPADLLRTLVAPAGDGAMRPVGELVFGIYKQWAHDDPLRWHLLGLSIHSLNIALVYALAFRLTGSSGLALAACALFGIHGSHAEPVAWIAALFDLLATTFSLAALIALTGRRLIAISFALPFLLFAILSKESAYVIPIAGMLLALGFRRMNRDRATVVAACFVLSAALFMHRMAVFGGPGGYIDPATGRAQILNVTPLSMLNTIFYRSWRTFLLPENLVASTNQAWLIAISVATLCAFGYAVFWNAFPRRESGFLIAAICVSLIPPIHVAAIRPDLLGARVFYLPSAFFAIWLARLIGSLEKPARQRSVAFVFVVLNAILLHTNLAIRCTVAHLARAACSSLAAELKFRAGTVEVQRLPAALNGVFFLSNGLEECAQDVNRGQGAQVVVKDASSLSNGGAVLEWNPSAGNWVWK